MIEEPDFIGRFPVVGTLGVGGMGVVYLAKDPDIGRSVAIKVLHANRYQTDLERFKNEARTIGEISHPNIVVLLEYGVDDGHPFLVMEYLEGEPLESWIKSPHKLSEHKTILLDLCHALQFAHEKKILHRDLKPGNVQVLPTGQAKLLDFGIARSDDSNLTVSGVLLGTPKYLAPETLETGIHSEASDCYSLGLLAYTMLSGNNPFSAPTSEAAILNQLRLRPPSLHQLNANIPVKLSKVIDQYLEKQPDKRPEGLALLRDTLDQLVSPAQLSKIISPTTQADHATPLDATVQIVQQSAHKSRKSRRGMTLAGLLILATGIAGWLFLSNQPTDTIPPATIPSPSQPTVTNEPAPSPTLPEPADTLPVPGKVVEAKDKPQSAANEKLTEDESPESAATSVIPSAPVEPKTITAAPADTNESSSKNTKKKPLISEITIPQKHLTSTTRKKTSPKPEQRKTPKVVKKKPADTVARKKPHSTAPAAVPPEPKAVQQKPLSPAPRPTFNLPSLSISSAGNRLKLLSSPQILRGKTTTLLIKASDVLLKDITEFKIYSGRNETDKLRVKHFKKLKNNLIELTLYAEPNAILGNYSLYGFHNGKKTRPVFLEVHL